MSEVIPFTNMWVSSERVKVPEASGTYQTFCIRHAVDKNTYRTDCATVNRTSKIFSRE